MTSNIFAESLDGRLVLLQITVRPLSSGLTEENYSRLVQQSYRMSTFYLQVREEVTK
jgi:hypothetical protein